LKCQWKPCVHSRASPLYVSKKENTVGLDIGSHSIKVVQVGSKDGSLRLLNLGIASVPHDAFVDGRVSKTDLVVKRIQELVTT